jgi:hypothetical protein
MNEPGYRERFELQIDDDGIVVASSTFSLDERSTMLRLRMAERVFEHFGLLRHVLRFLQWDHDVRMVDVLEKIVTVTTSRPHDYPLLSWVQHHLDVLFTPPCSWMAFYDEVEAFVEAELGIEDPALATVLEVQRALVPDRARSFPDERSLDHDYVAYHRSATATLRTEGRPSTPTGPLRSWGPGSLTVHGDPCDVGGSFRRLWESRPPDRLPGEFWQVLHFELDSPLTRWIGEVAATPGFTRRDDVSDAVAVLDGSSSGR